ncbi:MAG: FHA domain-containing protein [bacterium]
MAVLRGTSSETKGLSFELTQDETTIGRHGANMFVIADGSVSAFHCAIAKAGGILTLRDLDSTNGTKVNRELVKTRRLAAGDLVEVGNVQLLLEGADIESTVSAESVSPSAETRPSQAATVQSPARSPQSQFRTARRNSATVVWVTVGAVALLSAILVAVVAYHISYLK